MKASDLGADFAMLGADGSPTQVVKIFTPQLRQKGKLLTLESKDASKEIIIFMQQEKIY